MLYAMKPTLPALLLGGQWNHQHALRTNFKLFENKTKSITGDIHLSCLILRYADPDSMAIASSCFNEEVSTPLVHFNFIIHPDMACPQLIEPSLIYKL